MDSPSAKTKTSTAGNATFAQLTQKTLQLASAKFRDCSDWIEFFRDVLGRGGIIDRAFPSPRERDQFLQTDAYQSIQRMLAKLRVESGQPKEPTRMITVRMPASLHESLRDEAHRCHTSINKLCISKLLQLIDEELIPRNWENRGDGESGDNRRNRRTAESQ